MTSQPGHNTLATQAVHEACNIKALNFLSQVVPLASCTCRVVLEMNEPSGFNLLEVDQATGSP